MKKFLQPKLLLTAFGPLLAALALYAVGVKFLFVPVMIGSFILLTPFPQLFRSVLSRAVMGFMLAYATVQLAIMTQFFLFPQADFRLLAALTAVYAMIIISLGFTARAPKREPTVWIDRKDLIGLGVVAIFVVPFSWYAFGPDGLTHITAMAAVQVPDATNHFISLSDLHKVQHIMRQMGYYPKGFDLTTSFVQASFGLDQTVLAWKDNAVLFMAQYVVFNAILAYSLAYLAYFFLEKFSDKAQAARQGFLLVIGLGVPLALLYLLSFIFEGFLNFSYVCATIVLAFTYLSAAGESDSLVVRRWFIVVFWVLAFGTALSWPLLTPAMLLAPILYFWPQTFRLGSFRKWVFDSKNVPVILGGAIQFIPLYMDFRYSTPGSNSVNVPGALTVFHWGILAFCAGLVCWLLLTKTIDDEYRRFIKSVFVPFIILVFAILLFQYFTVGQPIYYAIKSNYIVELLTLALVVAWGSHLFGRSSLSRIEKLGIVAGIPLLLYMFLMAMNGANPLDDVRKLLRDHSHFGKPAFFDSDAEAIARLGEAGKILDFNVTILHYNPGENKLYANMGSAYWANAVHYNDNPANGSCSIGGMYGAAMYEAFSPAQQADLTKIVQVCIQLAQHNHEQYYIVSDDASVPYIKQIFGDYATVVR